MAIEREFQILRTLQLSQLILRYYKLTIPLRTQSISILSWKPFDKKKKKTSGLMTTVNFKKGLGLAFTLTVNLKFLATERLWVGVFSWDLLFTGEQKGEMQKNFRLEHFENFALGLGLVFTLTVHIKLLASERL